MALLPLTQLETHPVGATSIGGIVNGNWENLEAIAAENGFHRAAFLALSYGATITLDFLLARTRKTELAGNVTVAFDHLAAGADVTLILKADGSTRTLTWPAGVIWFAAAAPATLAAGKTLVVRFYATGTAASDVVAVWQVEP